MSAEPSYVAYGSEADADCVVQFVLSQNDSERPAKRARVNRDISGEPLADGTQGAEEDPPGANEQGNTPGDVQPIGDPLPGHRAILRQGSSFFQAQAGLWLEGKGTGDKPELRVPLGSPEDLPHALAAIRYMYTAKLQEGMSAAELLHARRLASYLGVEGCVEACRTALAALARSGTAEDPLAGVVQLYTVRHLLPCWDDDPAGVTESVFNECRAQLVAYKPATTSSNPSPPVNAGPAEPAEAPPPPPLASLLVWAFPDAPSVLSSPASRAHVSALPASSLELPPKWTWLRRREAGLIQQCAALPSLEERKRFAAEVVPRMGVAPTPIWYTSEPRPKARADVGRPYVWTTPVAEIDRALDAARLKAGSVYATGTFANGATAVVADGYEMSCKLRFASSSPKGVGVFLHVATPLVIAAAAPNAFGLAQPGSCRVVVWRWGPAGRRQRAYNFGYPATDLVEVCSGRGRTLALAYIPEPEPEPAPAPAPSPSPAPAPAPAAPVAPPPPLTSEGAAPAGAGAGAGQVGGVPAPLPAPAPAPDGGAAAAPAGAAAAPAEGLPSGPAATLLAPYLWEGKVWGCLTWGD
ncbi:hypothetical protein HYH03_008679 [Edaphochlamys debaryana]|uniref:BTB domain-containing protein n=1 Tax=Edaphochlamys debaryana TaxID=47281 RepID=A0A836BXQ8_9CHLO|nr:hypothetical protein HYH03_008679 [Edaphochlamys debaryana]|eukprot:KAG2493016.1 hypothetical protein HYH03_008679 [Edaphochlamys debaryana]